MNKDQYLDTIKRITFFEWIAYLLILAIPLYSLRIFVGAFSISVLDLLMLAVIMVGSYHVFIFEKYPFFIRQYLNKNSITLLFGAGMICTGMLIGLFIQEPAFSGMGITIEWFVLPFVTALILGLGMACGMLDRYGLLVAYTASASFVSLIALGYVAIGDLTYDGRLSAFYLSPNHLSMYISPAIVALALLLGDISNKKAKYTSWGVLILMGLILYLTYSYAAWGAVALSITLGGLLMRKISTKRLLVNGTLLLGFITALVLLQWDTVKLQDIIFLDERSSLVSRTMIWKSATHILKDNWLFGIGPGSFQEAYLDYQQYYPPYLEWAVPQPHNLYMAFWLQAGIIGFIGFIVLIISWIAVIAKGVRSLDHDTKKLSTILLAMMLSILIHGIVDTPYWKNDLSLLFWIMIFLGRGDSRMG